jgi:hypothetical protein
MLYRFAATPAQPAPPYQETEFNDSPSVADWAREPISWAVAGGVITGKPGALLDPLGTATRAEFAAILRRLDM